MNLVVMSYLLLPGAELSSTRGDLGFSAQIGGVKPIEAIVSKATKWLTTDNKNPPKCLIQIFLKLGLFGAFLSGFSRLGNYRFLL